MNSGNKNNYENLRKKIKTEVKKIINPNYS